MICPSKHGLPGLSSLPQGFCLQRGMPPCCNFSPLPPDVQFLISHRVQQETFLLRNRDALRS